MNHYFTFHCQSVGLHGCPFAVGWSVHNNKGVLESGYLACPFETVDGLQSDREWVEKNVLPHLPSRTSAKNVDELAAQFWTIWERCTKEYSNLFCVGYCAYPLDMSFLERCVRNNTKEKQFKAPFPLLEIATALLAIGEDPLANHVRQKNELPKYHPEKDAIYYGRLWMETCNKAEALWSHKAPPPTKLSHSVTPLNSSIRFYCGLDAKSVGLYGDLYDIALVIFNACGKDQKGSWRIWQEFEKAKGLPEDIAYRRKYALSAYPKSKDCTDVQAGEELWQIINLLAQNQTLFASWTPYPVDFRAIKMAIEPNLKERQLKGPYPLHDLGTLLQLSHCDPIGDYERTKEEEQTKHPVSGAHQCVRLFCEHYSKWRQLQVVAKL